MWEKIQCINDITACLDSFVVYLQYISFKFKVQEIINYYLKTNVDKNEKKERGSKHQKQHYYRSVR